MTMEQLQPFRRLWKEWVLVILLLVLLLVWSGVYSFGRPRPLNIYFLDVGQGDAIFIESPTHGRVLIDGGKNRKVVTELGKVLPFLDRRIDVVIATHPDADHIGGLPEVMKRYKVSLYMEPELNEDSELDRELEKRIVEKEVTKTFAKSGQVINFGDGARLTILFPDRSVLGWETNDASIVARLDYGESSFLFTGDAGLKTENTLIYHSPELLDVDVLKAGHHGSRTSTSLSFAEAVSPEITVISAGRDNAYGHPHREVIKILEKVGSEIKSTPEESTIRFETDGINIRLK